MNQLPAPCVSDLAVLDLSLLGIEFQDLPGEDLEGALSQVPEGSGGQPGVQERLGLGVVRPDQAVVSPERTEGLAFLLGARQLRQELRVPAKLAVERVRRAAFAVKRDR